MDYTKENNRFVEFSKAFIKAVKMNNNRIVTKVERDSLKLKINKKSIILESTENLLRSIPEKDREYFALVLTKENKRIDPESFDLFGSLVFKYKEKRFKWETDKEFEENFEKHYKYAFLINMSDFFDIKKAINIKQKFSMQNFSKIDDVILGRKTVEVVEKSKIKNEKLDEYQLSAFEAAISKNSITVIKGPPGTGKTYLAANIIKHFVDKKEKVVFASSLHTSLDSLINKMNIDEELSKIKVWRTTLKAFSSVPKEMVKTVRDAELFVTTLASSILDYSLAISSTILIIDEASAVNLFSVLSKTLFAKKIIVIGDNRQFLPIEPIDAIGRIVKKTHKNEWDVFFKKSLFETLFLNDNFVYELKNNYRSTKSIVEIVNHFYGGNLNSVSQSVNDPVFLKSFKTFSDLKNYTLKFIEKREGNDIICATYFKSQKNILNDALKKNGSRKRFVTSMSTQGLEANEVVIVITNGQNSIYQFDFRTINVLLSRAKEKINIFYIKDSIETDLLDKKKNLINFRINGKNVNIPSLIKKSK